MYSFSFPNSCLGTHGSRNSVSISQAETEFPEHAFPNRSLGTRIKLPPRPAASCHGRRPQRLCTRSLSRRRRPPGTVGLAPPGVQALPAAGRYPFSEAWAGSQPNPSRGPGWPEQWFIEGTARGRARALSRPATASVRPPGGVCRFGFRQSLR